MVNCFFCRLAFVMIATAITALLPAPPCRAQQMDVTGADTAIVINYIPKYSWSVGIEHSFIPQLFQQPAQYIPDNFEVQWWLGNRIYGEAGFHVFTYDSKNHETKTDGYAIYLGATAKLFLFPHAYFTPAWSLYYEQKSEATDSGGFIISTGPTAAFEYFIGNRFSLRLDLVNLSYGYYSSQKENLRGGQFSVYRALGLGARYNFDL